MIFHVWKLTAVLLVVAGVAGCSSATPTCSQQVATHPGMTCLDIGLGWYHAEFASMPADEHSNGTTSAPVAPVSLTLSVN